MAYVEKRTPTMPLPIEPTVLAVHLVAPTDGATADFAVYIPWKYCALTYAYTVTTKAEGNKGAINVDLELNAAGGTEMMSIAVAQNAAIGDKDEGSVTTAAACRNLGRQDTDRDEVNIELDGANTTTWEGMLYMYFEPDRLG